MQVSALNASLVQQTHFYTHQTELASKIALQLHILQEVLNALIVWVLAKHAAHFLLAIHVCKLSHSNFCLELNVCQHVQVDILLKDQLVWLVLQLVKNVLDHPQIALLALGKIFFTMEPVCLPVLQVLFKVGNHAWTVILLAKLVLAQSQIVLYALKDFTFTILHVKFVLQTIQEMTQQGCAQ